MSDPTSSTSNTGPEANSAEALGYEPEPVIPSAAAQRRANRDEQMKRNLSATFGSGPGKLALIAIAVVLVVFAVFAANGFRTGDQIASTAKVDAPTTPQNRVTTNPVTPEEAKRRAEQSQREAEEARNKGGSYQPGFDYNIGTPQARASAPAQFTGIGGEPGTSASNEAARNMTAGQAQAQANPQRAGQQEEDRARAEMQRAQEKLDAEVKVAEAARDKYVDGIKDEIVKQIGGMFSSQGSDSLNNLGGFSQARYYTPQAQTAGAEQAAFDRAAAALGRRALIKAGATMYATLDSEANTDDGKLVLATVRNGRWKGAKLIGQIEQTNDNMALAFTVMAPQDDRPTMRIRAVALREEDAKVGMAETIDHHTFSRYTALAAAAILSGAGRVYQQPIGTSIATAGGIITTTQEPTDRQVIGSAIGELGMSIGSEIRRRGFNRPSTYSTPALQGFTLYFLEDVAGDAAQQAGTPPLAATPIAAAAPGTASGGMPVGVAPGSGGFNPAQPVQFPATPFPAGVTPYTPNYGGTPPYGSPGYGTPQQAPFGAYRNY